MTQTKLKVEINEKSKNMVIKCNWTIVNFYIFLYCDLKTAHIHILY